MPVTYYLSALLTTIGFISACSSPASETSAPQEIPLVQADSIDMPFDTTLVDPIDALAEAQNILDQFLITFSESEKLPALTYSNAYEYESTREHHHYDGKQLKSIFIDHGYEGGGGGHLRILYAYLPDGSRTETVLYVPYFASHYEKGFFNYVKDGETIYYEVSGTENFYHPQIVGLTEPQSPDDNPQIDLKLIRDNTGKFTLTSGVYSWDIRREKVDSEYGETEIYERLEADSSVFRILFLSDN